MSGEREDIGKTMHPGIVPELNAEIERLRKALVWLYGAYQQECGIPLDALENSLIHVPVIRQVTETDRHEI